MTLQPIGAAVEKAGGLPQLKIWLDQDARPSATDKQPHPPTPQSVKEEEEGEDALLELLAEEDGEDEEDDTLPDLSGPDHQPLVTNKFKRLKGASAAQDQSADQLWNETHSGSKNPMSIYDNMKLTSSNRYQNVNEALDKKLLCAPMFDSVPNSEGSGLRKQSKSNAKHENNSHSHSNPLEDFDMQSNDLYTMLPSTTRPLTGNEYFTNRPPNENIYEELDDISRPQGMEERNEAGADMAESNYESLDSIFRSNGIASEGDITSREKMSGGRQGSEHNETDGGIMSQLGVWQPKEDLPEEMELVVFQNLPPLLCSAQLGDEVVLGKLSDTANSILTAVTKQIHNSLSEYRMHNVCTCDGIMERQAICICA